MQHYRVHQVLTLSTETARRIYAQARPLYHPVTTGSVDQLVGRS